jgi:hypothetical protein
LVDCGLYIGHVHSFHSLPTPCLDSNGCCDAVQIKVDCILSHVVAALGAFGDDSGVVTAAVHTLGSLAFSAENEVMYHTIVRICVT